MANLRILSCNAQGLQGSEKRIDVFEYIKNKNYDIYCLQDTHFIDVNKADIINQWGNSKSIFSNFKSNSRGVAILFNKDIDIKIHKEIVDVNGNFIIVNMTIYNQQLTLVNLYGPNSDNPNFFKQISTHIDDIDNTDIIICGDYNCVLNPELDYYNYKGINNAKARETILEIINEKYLIDPFRENHPTKKKFTWRKKSPCKQARLDYFLISESLRQFVKKSDIESGYRSDHSMVILELNFTNFKQGRSYWKHNNSLLSDIDYINIINEKILEVKRQYALPVYNLEDLDNIPNEEIQFTISDQLFLDVLLMEIRGKSISFASFKNKERDNREKDIIKTIAGLENNATEDKLEQIETLKNELINIRHEKLKGHMIRSRAQYIDQGEKPTKYFCALEKHNYVSKIICNLEQEDGNKITDQDEILKETKKFYEQLYKSRDDTLEDIDLEEYMKENEVLKLSNNQASNIEGILTYKEISNTLYQMKADKSPGISGLTAEFFKVFWKKLGHFVLRSINAGFISKELSITQRQGVITCIPKEDKPKNFLKNWRPLTLLDVVYKIASGAIANRFKQVLDIIISKDQTGFLKGRYIGENTRLIYDLMNHTEQNNIPGLLLLIDFEKAFDSLSWSFIQKVLKFLNFGPSICRWIETFYNNITSSVIQCGHMSESFSIGRGCRQGDPLSPYIFIICAEFLAIKIRQNSKIKGIKINSTEFKISQYADDTSIFLDGSSDALNCTLIELDKFANVSGLKINFDKTQVVWIGSKKYSTSAIKTKWKLSWGSKKFKILGIIFNVDLNQMIKENYTTKIQQLENLANIWSKRSMTPLGKITVIKTFMISIFNHLFIALPNPNQAVINYINNILYSFLWNKKPSKIKKTVITKQYCEGGLKMVNVNAFIEALKLTWIRRLLLSDCKWQFFIKSEIKIETLAACKTKYIEKLINNVQNTFWKDVLQSFINMNKVIDTNEEQVLKSPLFYNDSIKIGGSYIYYSSWFQTGIRYINDLLKDNGEFYTHEEFRDITGINSNTLLYYGTIRAIKSYLKEIKVNITHKEKSPFIPSHILPLLQQRKGSKVIYDILNKNKEVPTGKTSWNKVYDFSQEDWNQIYIFPFNITKYPALLWFQVSINHNILVTNKLLYRMKLRNNALCSFCGLNNETITHLLWQCECTKQFLKELLEWLKAYDRKYIITEEFFMFGKQGEHVYPKAVKFIIFYAKYYIYVSRCKQRSLFLNSFKKQLKFMHKVHQYIASKNNMFDTFQKEWSQYQLLMNDII